MKYLDILDKVRSVFTKSTGVEMSFGKPVEVNEMSIIPVARISFGIGFGGGSSAAKNKKDKKSEEPVEQETTADDKPQANEGGGGGGMNTVPVGIYTIKGDKVRFYPVISFKEMAAVCAVLALLMIRITKHKCKSSK